MTSDVREESILYLFTEARYVQSPDGQMYTGSSIDFNFLQRYLTVFDSVKVVARISEGSADGLARADGKNVEFINLSRSGANWLARQLSLVSIVRAARDERACVILRLPSFNLTGIWLRLYRLGYGVEVVGDPYKVLHSLSIWHRPLAPLMWLKMRSEVGRAVAASYVTQTYLQNRYPNDRPHSYSSIHLEENTFRNPSVREFAANDDIRLLAVGSLAQLYKGPDVLIRALAYLKTQGESRVRATWIGDGKHLEDMVNMAQRNDVHIGFPGFVRDRSRIMDLLADADIFVLPSRTEGLPRALIEAMAAGVPAIASDVGGIPELLEEYALFPPNQPVALANRIAELIADRDLRLRIARAGHEKAAQYTYGEMRGRRDRFYAEIKGLLSK